MRGVGANPTSRSHRRRAMGLWPKQQEALDLLVPAGRAIFGDAAGSGKTRTALAALDEWGSARALLLVPNFMVKHWIKQAQGQTDRTLVDGSGTAKQRLDAAILASNYQGPVGLVLNYEATWRDVDGLIEEGFDTLICDEAHRLKGRQTA